MRPDYELVRVLNAEPMQRGLPIILNRVIMSRHCTNIAPQPPKKKKFGNDEHTIRTIYRGEEARKAKKKQQKRRRTRTFCKR